MTRVVVILTAAWFLALGTGAVEYVHNAAHALEDARTARPGQPAPTHDDSNCPIHAQLHLPLIATPAIVLLISAGLLVAFLSELARPLADDRLPQRVDCRGPPALA